MSNKVTWLMPVKNGMPYLKECLESIYNQSYTNHEIIVWDNGSTDGSVEELKKWIQIFPKKYIKKYNLKKSTIVSFKNKMKILANIYSKKGLSQKIFIFRNLLNNFNKFNLMTFIKVFFPRFITSKFFFFNY